MFKSKRAQLKTMLAHALIFDSPYGMAGMMRCGSDHCQFNQPVTMTTRLPLCCPNCKLTWRFCTAPFDDGADIEVAAEIFNRRLPHLSFFVVNPRGEIVRFSFAPLRA